jgi:hypothetical protein
VTRFRVGASGAKKFCALGAMGRRQRPYWRMALAPYVSYTLGGEPKLRVGPGQGRAEPA